MNFLVTSTKFDQQLCVVSVALRVQYFPASKAWMVHKGSDIKDLRHRTG